MNDDELNRLIAEHTTRSFESGFYQRVMNRTTSATGRNDRFADLLLARFWRVAVAGLIVAMGLAGYNASTARTPNHPSQTVVESLFGLPPVTVDAAYVYESSEEL